MASHVRLDFLHVFGATPPSKIRSSISLTSDDSKLLIYPVGRHIAVRSLETDDVNVIREPERVTRITSMRISSEPARRFLAVGEYIQSERTPIISIFDLKPGAYYKRMRQLGFQNMAAQEFTYLQFSSDARLLAALVGAPEYFALVWDWYRDKLICKHSFGARVDQISFNPKDAYTFCTTGPTHWRIWHLEEKSFKQQPPITGVDRSQNYVAHAWLDEESLVAVAENKDYYIAKSNEVIQIKETGVRGNILSLVAGARGFYIGGLGEVTYFERSNTHNTPHGEFFSYDVLRRWETGCKLQVGELSLSSSENMLAVSHVNGDISLCKIDSLTQIEEEVHVHMINEGFHAGPVTGMDVAVQRPLLATCSTSDSLVKVWNYVTFKCEVTKWMSPEVSRKLLSVAFHPSGYYLAVGFEDKLQIMQVLFQDLRCFKELNVKMSTCLRYSNGGHLLAVASYKSVYLFSAFTLDQVRQLKFHSANVNDLAWSPDDLKLASTGADGGIFICDVFTAQKELEYPYRNTDFSSIVFAEGILTVCGVSNNNSLILTQTGSEFNTLNLGNKIRLTRVLDFESFHGTHCFIAGSAAGSVVIFGSEPAENPIDTILAHMGAVTRLRSSFDGRYIFSCGEDGAVFLYHVIEDKDLQPQMEKIELSAEPLEYRIVDESLADIVLVSKSSRDNFNSMSESYKMDYEKAQQDEEAEMRQQDTDFEEEQRKIERTLMAELEALYKAIEDVKSEKLAKESEWNERFGSMKGAHEGAYETVESLYEKKLALEDQKFREMEKEKLELRKHLENKVKNIQHSRELSVERLAGGYKDKLKSVQEEYEHTKKRAERLKLEYEERLAQQEDDFEGEVLKIRKDNNLKAEAKSSFNTTLRREIDNLASEKRTFDDEKNRLHNSTNKNIEELQLLDKAIAEQKQLNSALEAEKNEKDVILINKEKKIHQLKMNKKKKEKIKNVIESSKNEILDKIHPMEKEIGRLKGELQEVHTLCDKERDLSNDLKRKLEEKESQIDQMHAEKNSSFDLRQETEKKLRTITNAINSIVNNKDRKEWIRCMEDLFKTYVASELNKIHKKDPACEEEMREQLKYMERSEDIIKNTHKMAAKHSKTDLHKRTLENSTLIKELNQLREDKRANESKIKDLECEIKKCQQRLNSGERFQSKNATLPHVQSVPVLGTLSRTLKIPSRGTVFKGSFVDSKVNVIQHRHRISMLTREVDEKGMENLELSRQLSEMRRYLDNVAQQ